MNRKFDFCESKWELRDAPLGTISHTMFASRFKQSCIGLVPSDLPAVSPCEYSRFCLSNLFAHLQSDHDMISARSKFKCLRSIALRMRPTSQLDLPNRKPCANRQAADSLRTSRWIKCTQTNGLHTHTLAQIQLHPRTALQ